MAHTTQKRLVYLVPASPPTVPPTFSGVRELPDNTDGTDGSGDTPLGVTIGTTFPATPQGWHRHYLRTHTTLSPGGNDWFIWDPVRARWLATTTRSVRFGSTSGGTDITLNNPGFGASSATNGFSNAGRPFLIIASYAMCSTGVSGTVTIRLQSSHGQTHSIISFTSGQSSRLQDNRSILIPGNDPAEIWYCDTQGTVPAGMTVEIVFRRTEVNP